MALGHATYLDLTEEQRQQGAAKVRAQLKALLANPGLTSEQRTALRNRMEELSLWEAGTLHEVQQTTRHHVVTVVEDVLVKEEM